MGNKCAEPHSTRIIDVQFGDINHLLNSSGTSYDTLFYNFNSFREIDIEKVENHWQAIKEINTPHIAKPISIKPSKDNLFIIPRYGVTVEFNKYDRSLEDYAKDFLETNPLVFEITVINLISDMLEALYLLLKEGITHKNISPQTIFIDYNNNWILATPNATTVTLSTRIRDYNHALQYLLPSEISDKAVYDPFQADLYSLGITLLHFLYPFDQSTLKNKLQKADIDRCLDALWPYYSKYLLKLLKGITDPDFSKRWSIKSAYAFLNKLRDL